MQKLQNIIVFYKGLLPVNIAMSLFPLLFGKPDTALMLFLTIGFASAVLVAEVSRKNDYFFYNNNGLSNITLWCCSYLLNVIVAIVFAFSYNLFRHAF